MSEKEEEKEYKAAKDTGKEDRPGMTTWVCPKCGTRFTGWSNLNICSRCGYKE